MSLMNIIYILKSSGPNTLTYGTPCALYSRPSPLPRYGCLYFLAVTRCNIILGQGIIRITCSSLSIHYFVFYRTPFELNGTSCAIIVFCQAICAVFACTSIYFMVCLFEEVSSYTKTFIFDIKSMFDHVDDLAKSKKPELLLLECCKECVLLHDQVYE